MENVRTVGYVRADYANRNVEDVTNDVTKYGEWAKEGDGSELAMRGIFVDETPNAFTDELGEYLNVIGRHVKEAVGILGEKLVRESIVANFLCMHIELC
jgi:hypothetical protein